MLPAAFILRFHAIISLWEVVIQVVIQVAIQVVTCSKLVGLFTFDYATKLYDCQRVCPVLICI